MRVVMVCTGNICRSAMAEVVLVDRLLADAAGRAGGVTVTSAGVSDEEHGNPMDPRAVRVLAEHGYGQGGDDVARAVAARTASHRAHRITDDELAQADLVLAMTYRHYRELLRRAERLGLDGRSAPAVRMYRQLDPAAGSSLRTVPPVPAGDEEGPGAWWDDVAPAPSADLDVPDPWYGTTADFEDTLEVVERVSQALVAALRPTSPSSR